MLELIIVVLVILWLLGYFGRTRFPQVPGNLVHVLLVIVLILILVRLIR